MFPTVRGVPGRFNRYKHAFVTDCISFEIQNDVETGKLSMRKNSFRRYTTKYACIITFLIGARRNSGSFRRLPTCARAMSRSGTFNIDKSPAKGYKRYTLAATKEWQSVKSPSNKARNDIKYLCSTSL